MTNIMKCVLVKEMVMGLNLEIANHRYLELITDGEINVTNRQQISRGDCYDNARDFSSLIYSGSLIEPSLETASRSSLMHIRAALNHQLHYVFAKQLGHRKSRVE